MDEILEMSNKIDYGQFIYNFKGPTRPINLGKFGGPIYIYNHMKNGDTTLQQVQKQQKDLKKELNEITSGNLKHQCSGQVYIIKNVKNLYKTRQKIINLLNDNLRIRSESIYKSKQNETKGTGLKILTPKQMFQRLPVALAKVKAGNNSESLLNEIRKIVFSLYQSRQITKKVYNNIIKSINT